jgi:UbiD family decarboxylase
MEMDMEIDDLRDYLDILEEYEELQRVGVEVDWNLEMGAITRRCYDLGAPAVLFENVKGYPRGFRALGAPLGSVMMLTFSNFLSRSFMAAMAVATSARGMRSSQRIRTVHG